eukprot:m.58453 g.58453  ORF g.58453 m.58453 type:complete len:74 (-) comp9412_c0_seq1:14-235(-)
MLLGLTREQSILTPLEEQWSLLIPRVLSPNQLDGEEVFFAQIAAASPIHDVPLNEKTPTRGRRKNRAQFNKIY